MLASPDSPVTVLLHGLAAGDATAERRLYPAVYDELQALAHRHLRGERADHTLDTTGLAHEAYLRLAPPEGGFNDRTHFFALASRAMRQVLVDWARARAAEKRGGGVRNLTLDDVPSEMRAEDVLALDEALARLAARSARAARVVECRYFAGLTIEETAQALGISDGTVKADWRLARAWLFVEVRGA